MARSILTPSDLGYGADRQQRAGVRQQKTGQLEISIQAKSVFSNDVCCPWLMGHSLPKQIGSQQFYLHKKKKKKDKRNKD